MSWRNTRAQIAGLSRDRDPQDPELVDARRRLREEKLEEAILRAVADAPPLTAEQRTRLASILAPAVAEVAAERVNRKGVSRGAA